MEEERKQISIPIKTKIVAWLLIIIGAIEGTWGLMGVFSGGGGDFMAIFFVGIMLFIFGSLYFICGFFLLRGKRWAWWTSTVITGMLLVIATIPVVISMIAGGRITMEIYEFSIIPFITMILSPLFITPLLFLDRKKFWEIVS
ncbi:MAG: hypothetical protein CO034_01215 [Parcubacteria group bacterium CG_4_9_14_0_2_um_filter_35_11]|nr:MAG: hypothetical protein COS98_01340 [Parcubacteria group bacterium CG07_land_8_20_14_0_80_35_11]PJC47837.1 MAG: hypothetical protein CO034_01215 [Parcubacteria group bacterium CG_4_9_14_0_2_um_filter_35_11]